MNRKQLDGIVDSMIESVIAAQPTLTKAEAMTLLGIAFRTNSNALVDAAAKPMSISVS